MVPNFWTAIYIYRMDKDAEIRTEKRETNRGSEEGYKKVLKTKVENRELMDNERRIKKGDGGGGFFFNAGKSKPKVLFFLRNLTLDEERK